MCASAQLSFFDCPELRFGGATVEPEDVPRLSRQLEAVRNIMADGKWRTLSELRAAVSLYLGKNVSEAGISARLRDLRKRQFGALCVERERVEGANGLHRYRVRSNQ